MVKLWIAIGLSVPIVWFIIAFNVSKIVAKDTSKPTFFETVAGFVWAGTIIGVYVRVMMPIVM